MEENATLNLKMVVEICGGFLTWMGTAIIIMPLAWWATASFHWTNINWHAVVVGGIGAPITYLITGLIERHRNG